MYPTMLPKRNRRCGLLVGTSSDECLYTDFELLSFAESLHVSFIVGGIVILSSYLLDVAVHLGADIHICSGACVHRRFTRSILQVLHDEC